MIFLEFIFFLFPALAVLFSHGSRFFQLITVSLLGWLIWLDYMQLLSGEGGDRKGCEGCLFLYLLHILFGIIFIVLGLIVGFVSKNKKSSEPRFIIPSIIFVVVSMILVIIGGAFLAEAEEHAWVLFDKNLNSM